MGSRMQRPLPLVAQHVWLLAITFAELGLACSGGDAGTGGQGGSDGKFHPKADGVAVDEAAACDTLHAALDAKQLALSCTLTLRTCPALVQVVAGTSCSQFDQGTVKGCADYISKAADCADLGTRSNNCAFKAIAGSAPKGCPAK